MNKNVYCWYDGPSELTGEPILAFLFTGITKNAKIGTSFNYTLYVPRTQDYIDDMQSNAVCGSCPLKKSETKTCYVPYYQLVTARKWTKQYDAGQLRFLTPSNFSTAATRSYLRLGISGDPASVPVSLTRKLMSAYKRTISYTHQYLFADDLKDFSLVSTQSRTHAQLLHARGFRTARISADGNDLLPNEVVCKAQKHENVSCSQCQLCDRSTKNIVFVNHAKNKGNLEALLS